MEIISVTRGGVQRFVDEINKRYGGEIVSADLGIVNAVEHFGYVPKDMGKSWFICVAGRLHHEATTLGAIEYLRRIKKGLKLYAR